VHLGAGLVTGTVDTVLGVHHNQPCDHTHQQPGECPLIKLNNRFTQYFDKIHHYHKIAEAFLDTLTVEQKLEFAGFGRAWALAKKEAILLVKSRFDDPVFCTHQAHELNKVLLWIQNPTSEAYGPDHALPTPDFTQLVLPAEIKSIRGSIQANVDALVLNNGGYIDLNVALLLQKKSISFTHKKSDLTTGNISLGATVGVTGGLFELAPDQVEGGFVTFSIEAAPKDFGAGVTVHYALEYPPRIIGASITGLLGFAVSIGLSTTATVILPILS